MYKFDPNGEPVDAAFRAIALDQLDEALADLNAPRDKGRSVVHEARRRCKKLRGLLRLVQPAFDEFVTENAALRDAAGVLSHLRDGEVMYETVAALQKWRPDPLLASLADRPLVPSAPANGDAALDDFRNRLAAIRDRAQHWSLHSSEPRRLFEGMSRIYRSGRRRMKAARQTHRPTDFHDWRKANKYFGFHLDLLKKAAPEAIAASLDVVDKLSLVLGEHHDLVVLRSAAQHDALPLDASELAALIALVDARMEELEHDAFELGRQVFAEDPAAVAKRIARYWATAA